MPYAFESTHAADQHWFPDASSILRLVGDSVTPGTLCNELRINTPSGLGEEDILPWSWRWFKEHAADHFSSHSRNAVGNDRCNVPHSSLSGYK